MIANAIISVEPNLQASQSMKVSKEKAAENRAARVRAAGFLLRERGIDGVGVAEISKKAGLTHGALYAQFPSKEALAAEAFASAAQEGFEEVTANRNDRPPTLSEFLDSYLSIEHRDNLATSCPMSASASEIARQDKVISESFKEGFEQIVAVIESRLGTPAARAEKHQRALAVMAALIGGVAASRAVAKADSRLSTEILQAVRRIVGAVGGEEGQVDGARGKVRATGKRLRRSRVTVRQ